VSGEVVIVGAGPAGLTAAHELSRHGVTTTILERDPEYVGGLARTVRHKGSRFDVIPGHADIYFNEQNFDIVEKLRRKSERCDVSMVRLAMGWVLQKESITSVLVGATDVHHLENAVAALEMPFPMEWINEMDEWGASSASFDGNTQTK